MVWLLLVDVEWLPLGLEGELQPVRVWAREVCMEGMGVELEALFSKSSSAQEECE